MMKIVLLPGMDGTGDLFSGLLRELPENWLDVVPLSLPNDGLQSYEELSARLSASFPSEDFILVAESFSGGIAATLSVNNCSSLKAIIFVASFLSAPNKLAAFVASCMPIKSLMSLPFFNMVCRTLLLGQDAKDSDIKALKRVLLLTPDSTLRSRLRVIASSRFSGFRSKLPVVHIGAVNDKLVSKSKRNEFQLAYEKITFVELEGPHFLMQTNSKAGADAIVDAVSLLMSKIY